MLHPSFLGGGRVCFHKFSPSIYLTLPVFTSICLHWKSHQKYYFSLDAFPGGVSQKKKKRLRILLKRFRAINALQTLFKCSLTPTLSFVKFLIATILCSQMFYYSLLATECKLISSEYSILDMLRLREHASLNLFPPKNLHLFIFRRFRWDLSEFIHLWQVVSCACYICLQQKITFPGTNQDLINLSHPPTVWSDSCLIHPRQEG